jgi:hypothetical protein
LPNFILSNIKYLKKLIKIVSVFGFIAAIFGFLTINNHPIGKYQGILVSFITHPNNTSIIFTISIPASIFIYYLEKDNNSVLKNVFYMFSILSQFIAQLFTYTRAGIIASLIGILIFFIFYYRSKIIWIFPVSIPIFFILYSFLIAKDVASFFSRLYLLIPAYFMITENNIRLLWGYGLTNAFIEYKKSKIIYTVLEENIDDPHNTYVSLILMFGLIVTILMLLVLIIILFRVLATYFKSYDKCIKLFTLYSFTFITSILIQGLFDSELIIVSYFSIQILLTIIGINYLLLKNHNGYFRLHSLNE